MGGLGKTTLAQEIYNNDEVETLFPCRAWSYVSKDYHERKVLLSLLYCLKSTASKYEHLNEEKLKEEVRKCVKGSKYLVVLDDVWEPEVWNKVKDAFPNNNNGSMILITSRNDEVAYYTRSRHPHQKLRSLNEEESWELFCMKVFGEEECPPHLEPIGRSIVERCGGLPLAIITLARLVAKKERSYLEWSQIEGFVPWYLAEDNSKVIDVLKVSYDNLPKILKSCFLYFGIYLEGYKIHARELIQLWIAEGFIKPEIIATSKVPKPEVVGEKYLNELVDRNLVQVVERWTDGGVKICRIHDLFRELCILESKASNFLEICLDSTNKSLSNPCILSSLCNTGYFMSLIKCNKSSTCSLFLFDVARSNFPDYTLKNFPLVHVLHVAREADFRENPCFGQTRCELTKMVHLKYLRLGDVRQPRYIPDCIWSLCNLETLDLRGWSLFNRTISIWKLEQLRHIYVEFHVMLAVDNRGANRKPMSNLQTLTRVKVERQTMFLVNNGNFPNLTKLGLRLGFLPHEQVLNLHNLSNLRRLNIDCCFMKTSLDGIVFPSNISKITLRRFVELDSGWMSTLGRITSLQILKLVDGSTTTDTLNCGAASGDFPQLQVFYLDGLNDVKRLTIENGAMPHLQRMVIHGCFDLEEAPERLLSLSDSYLKWRLYHSP